MFPIQRKNSAMDASISPKFQSSSEKNTNLFSNQKSGNALNLGSPPKSMSAQSENKNAGGLQKNIVIQGPPKSQLPTFSASNSTGLQGLKNTNTLNTGSAPLMNLGAQSGRNNEKINSSNLGLPKKISIIEIYQSVIKQQKLNKDHLETLKKNYTIIIANRKEDDSLIKIELLKSLSSFFKTSLQGNDKPEQHQLLIMKLWLEVAYYFLKQYPFCRHQAIIQLIVLHQTQNSTLYFQKGKYSPKFISQVQNFLFRRQQTSEYTLNKNCDTFVSIIAQLRKLLKLYCQYINAIFQKLSDHEMYQLKIINAQLVDNMCQCIKTITSYDDRLSKNKQETYLLKNQECTYSYLKLSILQCLKILLRKDNARQVNKVRPIFSKEKVTIFYQTIDQNIEIMEIAEKKQAISICCEAFLEFPYALYDWKNDQKLKKCILKSKNKHLNPFRWLLQIINNSQNQWHNDPIFNQPQHVQDKNAVYNSIQGEQWLSLASVFISKFLQQRELKLNERFQKMLFNLVCSIIAENPKNFWQDTDKYANFYKYIRSILQAIVKSRAINQKILYEQFEMQQLIGKLFRLMICCCSKTSDVNNSTIQTEYLLNNFLSNIYDGQNQQINQKILYSQLVLPYILSDFFKDKKQTLNGPRSKYHFDLPLVAHQLLAKIGTDCPRFLLRICALENSRLKILQQKTGKITETQLQAQELIYLMIFPYLSNIIEEQRLIAYNYAFHQSHQNQTRFRSILNFIKVLCTLDQSCEAETKLKHCMYMVLNKVMEDTSTQTLSFSKVYVIFEDLLITEKAIENFSEHIIYLYNNRLENLTWLTKLCLPIMHQKSELFEANNFRNYLNIFTAILKKKLSETREISDDSIWQNKQIIEDRSIVKSKSRIQNLEGQIRLFLKNQDRILLFINWALKIEEDQLLPHHYYNILFEAQEYSILYSALNLLQMLMNLYLRFEHEYYIPQKLQGFFSLFKSGNKHVSLLKDHEWTNSARNHPYNIHISNNKLATIPSAIAYLIASNNTIFSEEESLEIEQNQRQILYTKNKALRSAINILSLIILYHKKVGIQTDFKVYKSFFIDDFNNVDCSADQTIINYLIDCLKADTNNNRYSQQLSGQNMDLLMLLVSSQQGQEWSSVIKIINKRITRDKKQIQLKQVYALSRFLVLLVSENQFTNRFGETSKQTNQLIERIIEIIVYQININLNGIKQEDFVEIIDHKLDVLIANLFRTVRILQLQKKNGRFFAKVIQHYLPTLMNNRLLEINCIRSIQAKQRKKDEDSSAIQFNEVLCAHSAVQQYFIALELIMCCKTYLTEEEYLIVIRSKNFQKMIVLFIETIIIYPQFYTLAMYALKFYGDIERKVIEVEKNKSDELQEENESVMDGFPQEMFENFTRYKSNSYQKLSFIGFLMMRNILSKAWKTEMQDFCSKLILSWTSHNFIKTKSKQKSHSVASQIIQEALLLNVIHNPDIKTIDRAIQMGMTSTHSLTFVSVMNHLYNAVINSTIYEDYSHQGSSMNINAYSMPICVISFAENILKADGYSLGYQANLYMKAWSCNIINAVLATSTSEDINYKVADMLLNSNHITGLLGKLLEKYTNQNINWQYSYTSLHENQRSSSLGLLEKQLLLTILKLLSTFLANYQYWSSFLNRKKPKESIASDQSQRNRYNALCQSIVQASVVLGISGDLQNNPQAHKFSKNQSRNNYESSIQSISMLTIIEQSIAENPEILKTISTQHLKAFESAKKLKDDKKNAKSLTIEYIHNCLFAQTANCLDFIHQYIDTLISERFVMILFCCYENKSVGLLQYEDLLKNMEKTAKKLLIIEKESVSFQKILETADKYVWKSSNMSNELFYLNYIEEGIDDYIQLLNDKLQLMMSCCNRMKVEMQLHKNYKYFCQKTSKIMKHIKANEHAYRFDVGKYYNQGGFGDRSQYGQSMISATMRFK